LQATEISTSIEPSSFLSNLEIVGSPIKSALAIFNSFKPPSKTFLNASASASSLNLSANHCLTTATVTLPFLEP